MPEDKTEKEDNMKEEGEKNFNDFLDSFSGVEEAIREHTRAMSNAVTIIAEDLIPAIDDLAEETKTSRVIMAQLQGRKQPKKESILDQAANEIFGK